MDDANANIASGAADNVDEAIAATGRKAKQAAGAASAAAKKAGRAAKSAAKDPQVGCHFLFLRLQVGDQWLCNLQNCKCVALAPAEWHKAVLEQVNKAVASAAEETKRAGAAAADAAGTVASNVAESVKEAATDDSRSAVVQQVRKMLAGMHSTAVLSMVVSLTSEI